MIYEFECKEHGRFEAEQPILTEHKALCPQCGTPAQRIYTLPRWIWAGTVYKPDGSKREDKDYAVLKG